MCFTQYRKLIYEGSDLYLSHVYGRAAELFKAALDVIARSTSEELAIDGDDLAFIWLIYGLSCVKAEHTRNVPAAIERFNAIISQTAAFPAAFYGLALAYVQLKRYQEARAVLVTGLARLGECEDVTACHWPGTNTVVEETVGPTLKKLMEDLLKETMFPPKPDAICKFHVDTDNLKKEMYFTDPDYKGHVCVKCRAGCTLDCHAQCWKPNDYSSRGKRNWKEVLDTLCPTPGCWGTISEVLICKPAPDKTLKLSSQVEIKPKAHQPRPKLKMKTASASKLERKMERKRLRKERRQAARQEFQDQQANEEELENINTRIILPADEVVNINIDRTGIVLRKDEPEVLTEKKQKVGKSKKKEKKQKQFLPVDVQFKGDENKERYGINSLDDDGDAVNTSFSGLLPTPGSEPNTATSKTMPFQQPALEIALYEFFYKLLLAKGPLELLSKEIEDHTKHLSEEAQTYILSYGGLGRFLAAHHQFIVSQNKTVSAIPAGLLGNPLLGPQVNPLLAPLLNPGLVPHMNPWETRQLKPTEAQHARAGLGHVLNPSAKQFVPQNTAAAPALPNSQQGDQDELADGCADTSSHLPPPATDDDDNDDDGFTTVVNKRRVNIQKLSSVVQPRVHKFDFLKPASSMNSLDEIQVDSPLPQRVQVSVTAVEGDQDQVDGGKYRQTSHGNINSLDNFLDDFSDVEPCVRKDKNELKTDALSLVMNKPSPASDVSEISGGDLHHRVSSPALSTNSSGSSGRAEGSQTSNSTSSQITAPRPLKAPSILLPTRGKHKRPLAPKLFGSQHLPAADGSLVHDKCEEESLSVTSSDRDSMCGDTRASTVVPPATASAGKDGTSVVREPVSLSSSSGHDVFSSSVHDSILQFQHPNSGMEKNVVGGSRVFKIKALDSDEMITRNQGFGAGMQGWSKMWPESLTAEKVPLHSSLSDLKVAAKSGNVADERQEKSRTAVFDSSTFQAPVSQTQAKVLNLVTKRSDDQCQVNVKTLQDATWPSWVCGLPDNYRKASDGSGEDVRLPPSDPWQNEDQANAQRESVPTDLFGENPDIAGMFANTHTSELNHLLSNKDDDSGVFCVRPFSTEYGLIGSGKVKSNDPWSSRLTDSPTSLSTDITFHRHISQASPFPAWIPAPSPSSAREPGLRLSSATEPSIYSSSTHTEPSFYTSSTHTEPPVYTSCISTEPSIYTSCTSMEPSVHTADSSTDPTRKRSEPLSFTIDTSSESVLHRPLTKPSKNKSVVESTVPSPSFTGAAILPKHPEQTRARASDGRIARLWEHEQISRESMEPPAAQCRTVDTQTDLTSIQIDEILEGTNMLKDSRAQLASLLHEKLELQEQLRLERSANDELKHDNNRLLTKIHVAESSSEKWKDDYNQLIQTDKLLTVQVRTQTETINQLTTQMDLLKATYLNAQMDMLAMKKDLTNSKLDVKQQEALHHFHRLSNVIEQSKTSDRKLPESVYEKQAEFSEYIAMCDRLRRHVEVVYLKLAGDLQRGQVVDMTQLELSPPNFPKSPTESSERPQTSTNSSAHVDSRLQPSPACSLTSAHSSPLRGHSSMHSSPSHSCQSPSPQDISSLPCSPSHSGLSGHTSPPHSTTSGRSLSPHGRLSNRSSPKLDNNHQMPAGSVLKPEAQSQEAEDDDADAYLKMIYGGSSSADPLTKVTGATSASRILAEDVDHKRKVPDPAGRQGWKPTSSRLLPSPARLTTHTWRVPQSGLAPRTLPGPTQSSVGGPGQATSVPYIRAQSKPHTSHTGSGQSQQQLSYFEQIVQTVQDKLPGCSRNDIQKVVDTVRRNSGGTLSDWTFEMLTNEILDMLLDLDKEQNLATATDECGPVEHELNSIWECRATDSTCSICQCVVKPLSALTLACGHTFHKECALKWLTNDRSCPNCRSHALLSQDFPVLK